MATIAVSGGTAVATKIHWVKRAWALAELAGAVENIVVNHSDVNPRMKGCVDVYNGAMGLIGIYHAGKGIINFATKLTESTKYVLRQNQNLQAIVKSKYLDWQAEIGKLGELTSEELKLKNQQEQVWRMLGVAEEIGDAMASKLKPLGLGSTGRTTAANLVEQMAMKDAMENPQIGKILENIKPLSDPRWQGWLKMEYSVKTKNNVNAVVYYVGKWENGVLKAVDDFKFK